MSDNDLVFLVPMSGGPTAGRDKSVINAHVSKQTHSRRRRERILQAQRDQDQTNTAGQAPGPTRLSFSGENINPQTVLGCSSPNSQQVLVCDSPITSPSAPALLDRFESFGLLDTKAEDYLRFGREVLEPAIHSVGYRGWATLESSREEYVGPDLLTGHILADSNPHSRRADCIKVFVFAILAYCASGFAAVNQAQHAHHDALNYTISCMKSLREYLDNLNHNIDDISEDLVYRLFRAEVLANNESSASAHGKLLKNIFEHKAHTSSLKLDVLSNTLWQDNQRAFSSWSRPIFEERWVREQYQHEWQQASAMFDLAQAETHRISKCVKDKLLRSHLYTAKRLLVQTQILTKRAQPATPSNFYWFATQCEWSQMCLMNYYLDRDPAERGEDDVADTGSLTSLNMCLCLATLYVLRHARNDVHVQGRPLFQGCKNIYLRIDTRLSALSRAMSREDSEASTETIVFVLFVAAVAEHQYGTFHAARNAAYAWRRRLGQFLVANEVRSWEEMYSILSKFPWTEDELPTPHTTWLQEILSEATSG